MIYKSLFEELRKVKELKKEVKNSLKHAPKGMLRSKLARGKYPQFYLVTEEIKKQQPQGRYLKASEAEMIKRLAQKEYDQALVDMLERRESAIERFLKAEKATNPKNAYDDLTDEKKSLIIPYILTDEQFVKQWCQEHIGVQNSFPISTPYETERGETVRSKSEKIIADKLFYKGIPYQYEPRLLLKNGKTIYPDFAALNVRERKTYYIEHLGRMDDEEYSLRTVEKIEWYELSEIYPGEQLLITMESSIRGLNTKLVDQLVERYLV